VFAFFLARISRLVVYISHTNTLKSFLQYNQRDALISQIYFWNRSLHVSVRFSVHHQESSTVHTAIGICHTGYADCLPASSKHNLYVLLCIQY
jgi:hypothetical protein